MWKRTLEGGLSNIYDPCIGFVCVLSMLANIAIRLIWTTTINYTITPDDMPITQPLLESSWDISLSWVSNRRECHKTATGRKHEQGKRKEKKKKEKKRSETRSMSKKVHLNVYNAIMLCHERVVEARFAQPR